MNIDDINRAKKALDILEDSLYSIARTGSYAEFESVSFLKDFLNAREAECTAHIPKILQKYN